MFNVQNRFRIPLPHLYRMQTHQEVLEGISTLLLHIDKKIRLSDLTRCHYRNTGPLLNYLILIAKLYYILWGCRSNQTLPIITAFSSKVIIKYETEKYVCVKTNKMDKFIKKWTLPLDSVP